MLSTDLMLASIITWSFSDGTTIYKEVLINATTKISCSPDEDIQIQWHHTGPGRFSYHLYAGGRFFSSSNRGFRLEKDSNTGPYHIVIPHARTEDAGLYECKEDGIGSRLFGSTHLTVVESNPVCGSDMSPHDGYVGPTTCKLTEEDMTFTCAVSFIGEPPQMKWKILNDWQPFNESMCKTENGQITCSLIIKADSKYDGSILNCQSTKSSANCNTEIIKVQYFESQSGDERPQLVTKNVGDKVNCSVKSNQKLEFRWTVFDGVKHASLVKDQELLIQSPGLYRCVVEYSIRHVPCDALVIEVNANTTTCPPPKETAASSATAAATTIIVLAILVICISAIYRI